MGITHYISAFANNKGGRIYYGIEDKERRIKGQKIRKEDFDTLAENIQKILSRMRWGKSGNKKPKRGEDWTIQYIPVFRIDEEIKNLFVIVVIVRQFPNGVFSECPVSYKLNQNKRPQVVKYEEWRERMQPPKELFFQCDQVIDQDARKKCFKLINKVDIHLDQGYGV